MTTGLRKQRLAQVAEVHATLSPAKKTDDLTFAPAVKKMLKEPDAKIGVTRHELLGLLLIADKALDGDSNDDEHDALYQVREALGEFIEEPERRSPETEQQTCNRCDKLIPLGKDESTRSGSMHRRCAATYQRQIDRGEVC